MTIRLKERREELGLTLEEVGKLTGVGKSTVRKWETGFIQNMGRDKIVAYAKALRINPMDILDPNNSISDSMVDKISTLSSKLTVDRQEKVYNFTEQQYNEQNKIIPMTVKSEVELYGAVSAGTGEYLLDNTPELVPYEGEVPEHDYAVIVNGVSMRPLFEDKQIIFVKKTFEARSGQVVIAYYDNQAYVKKYVNDEKGARFVSLNKSYDDMPIDETHEAEIIGVVVL
ncbi:S24 family peptidase [Leuconostoc suionicum]|uniref:helix-turn-helix domain-containing protein n=1 Tax=Leuconostoc suionicum TaxID=1511761 RepID=UPI0024AE0498|nr:S24 family peptidase [Leuconostoc suionicum]MDI6497158.1 S24 family peptidase [Leuconostoc suionicum]